MREGSDDESIARWCWVGLVVCAGWMCGCMLWGIIRITSQYSILHGSHFGLLPSSIHRITEMDGSFVWTVTILTFLHRPLHCGRLLLCHSPIYIKLAVCNIHSWKEYFFSFLLSGVLHAFCHLEFTSITRTKFGDCVKVCCGHELVLSISPLTFLST